MKLKIIAILPLLASLTACVHHFSETECKITDWKNMGAQDAMGGNAPRDLQSIITDCQKFNISVDTQAYGAGYQQGVANYCTPTYDDGVNEGSLGTSETLIKSRQGFCNQHGHSLKLTDFDRGYAQGLRKFCTNTHGNTDGSQGKAENPVCAESSLYKTGYLSGIASYCSYDRAKSLAAQAQAKPAICISYSNKKFDAGWLAGTQQLCGNASSAFDFGKRNASYPSVCSPVDYPNFKRQYDRGHNVYQRVQELTKQQSDAQTQLNNLVKQYALVNIGGRYTWGKQKTQDALLAAMQANKISDQIETIKQNLFQTNNMN